MSEIDTAVRLFDEGYACSQAVIAAYAPRYGVEQAQALRMAAAFGGGMRLGEACGAATGAFMVLGLALCSDEDSARTERPRVTAAVQEFVAAFRERAGGLDCPEILGCDIRTPEGKAASDAGRLTKTICPAVVRIACEILDDMLPVTGASGTAPGR